MAVHMGREFAQEGEVLQGPLSLHLAVPDGPGIGVSGLILRPFWGLD